MFIKKVYDNQIRTLLANNITYFRLQKHWSQEDLADKIGTNAVYVSNLENGKKNVRVDYIGHLANIFGITPDQLFIKRDTIKNRRVDLQ